MASSSGIVQARPALTYLNNRYYDPTTGVFINVDPLVGRTQPDGSFWFVRDCQIFCVNGRGGHC